MTDRTDVLGVGFDSVTMEEALERAMTLMEEPGAKWMVTPNPEIVWTCRENEKLKKAVEGASLVLPDGIGVVYGAKILGRPLKAKVGGADFAAKLLGIMGQKGKKVFLLGSKPGVAEAAADKMRELYPGLIVCGVNDGYFKDSGPVVEKINEAAPDFLMVCLGAPKQEEWMLDNAPALNVRLMAGLGGTLDVFAGTAKRAPQWMLRLNLEWLYRLCKQPSRIGRMMKLPAFLLAVIAQRLRKG